MAKTTATLGSIPRERWPQELLKRAGQPSGTTDRHEDTMTRTDRQVHTRHGYAVGVECHQDHSGNRRYVLSQREWWQCQGCGYLRATDRLRQQQRECIKDRK